LDNFQFPESGCVYSRGNNRFGQLGHGDYVDREKPTIIKMDDIIYCYQEMKIFMRLELIVVDNWDLKI
jgi:alpha-tubulin suppressor-like RCC1 family protein